jgi:tetratricopeptide (TPR) repeat protein
MVSRKIIRFLSREAWIERYNLPLMPVQPGVIKLITLSGLIILTAWFCIQILSFTFVTKGSQLLNTIYGEQGSRQGYLFVCLPHEQDADNTLLQAALIFLNRSARIDPGNSRTHLLLGRSYCALGDEETALNSYISYTNLRPKNPLAHLETGFVYLALASEKPEFAELAVQAWQRSGVTAEEMDRQGKALLKAGQWTEASAWNSAAILTANALPDDFEDWAVEEYALLESFVSTNWWKPCEWCGNVQGTFTADRGILEASYPNDLENREGFAYRTTPSIPLNTFQNLSMRLKGDPGTLFTLEVVVDKERSRLLSYIAISEEWAVISIPIKGTVLNEIMINIGEPASKPRQAQEYQLWIDWIALH